jgi:hypothetical protein
MQSKKGELNRAFQAEKMTQPLDALGDRPQCSGERFEEEGQESNV